MLEDVHDSAERLSAEIRTAHTSDRAGSSPARVAEEGRRRKCKAWPRWPIPRRPVRGCPGRLAGL